MTELSTIELIEQAKSVLNPTRLPSDMFTGDVGCALLSAGGNLYHGVCMDIPCGIGFCAEHSAIAAMVTHGEFQIKKIVAVCSSGKVIPPCGRCREFMRQIHSDNEAHTQVLISEDTILTLKDLLPHAW